MSPTQTFIYISIYRISILNRGKFYIYMSQDSIDIIYIIAY